MVEFILLFLFFWWLFSRHEKRIYIGQDAKVMNFLNRVNPNWAAYLINKQMKDLLK